MGLISVNPEQIMEQLGAVLASAEPLARNANPGVYSGLSTVVDELLNLCGRLTACASAYHGGLESDVSKAGAMLDQLKAEDEQVGVMLLTE